MPDDAVVVKNPTFWDNRSIPCGEWFREGQDPPLQVHIDGVSGNGGHLLKFSPILTGGSVIYYKFTLEIGWLYWYNIVGFQYADTV